MTLYFRNNVVNTGSVFFSIRNETRMSIIITVTLTMSRGPDQHIEQENKNEKGKI